MSRLSQSQVEQYNRDGYALVHELVFEPEKFQRLCTIFEEDLLRYGEADLDLMHMRDERLLEFLLCDEVLDLVEPVVGPNIGLWSSHFISKSPYTGKATPWHEDSSYWKGLISEHAGICTVWLAIDRATSDNGCMRVIPGTHHNGYSQYAEVDSSRNIFNTEIVRESIDEEHAVYFELEPNQCSLHEARIIHGARANTSPHRRAGYTMRYFPTSSKIHTEAIPNHRFWLARGEDIAGNKYEKYRT